MCCTLQSLVTSNHLDVAVPHGGQVAAAPRHQDGGHQREGDQVEEGGLGRVHQEQGDEGGDEAEDVGHGGDGPVQLPLDPRHQVVAVGEGQQQTRHQNVPEALQNS